MDDILNRGVEEIIDRPSLEEKLKSGQKLRVKLGIDPTSPNLHLGRSIPLLKLRDFQKAGHKVVFIVGDFTGVIGDTSDKDSERPMLNKDTIKENLKTYKQQASKILDIDEVEFHYNSEWLSKLSYEDISKQADVFSLSDFISRDNIKRRLDAGKRVSLRELLYPLMQGYDSVAVESSVEIGGTDQRFNLLSGRDIQKMYGQNPQDILMSPLIEGTDGRKMSSSYGNTINFTDNPNDMYGKVMGVRDELIIKYFTLLTRVPTEEIGEMEKQLDSGVNPKDIKMKLARALTEIYHGSKEAENAEQYFINTFSLHKIREDIIEMKPTSYNVLDVLVESNLATSKSDARRLVGQGGVRVNGITIEKTETVLLKGDLVEKGKLGAIKLA